MNKKHPKIEFETENFQKRPRRAMTEEEYFDFLAQYHTLFPPNSSEREKIVLDEKKVKL